MTAISVIGGGAWGTALAASLARTGKSPLLWMRDGALAGIMAKTYRNPRFLDGIELPQAIRPTARKADIGGEDILLVAVPAQSLRAVLEGFGDVVSRRTPLVLCAKGIEKETGRRVSEIARDVMAENPLAILSGPSFAHDVARGLPTAVTLAADSLDRASALAEAISGPALRLYASDDVTGVELGGALKNVIALSVGMARARGLGASAEAALTTRGFAELSRIARHYGARPQTLMGLSGLGDLMLTCSSPQSRNFAYGMAVGAGADLHGLKLAEGVYTTKIAAELCRDAGIEAPIIQAIDAVLSGALDIGEAMAMLLARPLKVETL